MAKPRNSSSSRTSASEVLVQRIEDGFARLTQEMRASENTAARAREAAVQPQYQTVSFCHQQLEKLAEQDDRNSMSIRELVEKQSADNQRLSERISDVQTDLTEKMSEQTERLTKHFDESVDKLSAEVRTQVKGLNDRVTALEVWRWVIMGGSIVVMFVLGGILVRLLNNVLDKGLFQ